MSCSSRFLPRLPGMDGSRSTQLTHALCNQTQFELLRMPSAALIPLVVAQAA